MLKHMKKLILILFLFAGWSSFGQSIYDIKYGFYKLDKNGKETSEMDKEYHALLFYNGTQGSSTMRTRYNDATYGWVIVEQKMTTELYTKNGKNYWALVGHDPVFISTV